MAFETQNSDQETGNRDPVDKQYDKVMETASERSRKTMQYFEITGKSFDDFVRDLAQEPFKISFQPSDPESLADALFQLQYEVLELPLERCDGTCGPFTFKEFKKAQIIFKSKAERGNIISDEQPTDDAPATVRDKFVDPYRPGENEKIVTPKADIEGRIQDIYQQNQTTFFNGWKGTKENLAATFGRSFEEVRDNFITEKDPLTGEPITFLGRPIKGGINVLVIPFMKIAEENIRKSGVNYQPASEQIGGFQYRDMKVRGKASGIPSFHKFGLALDLDEGSNGPSYNKTDISPATNRGNIPDQVVLAMANAGFAWGAVGDQDFSYLGDDPMHFQLRFDPREEQGQAIIHSSETGEKYWDAIVPMVSS